jgi:hypothetical protein
MSPHWGNLGFGPSILTSGGSRSANALIFSQSVISPQYCGGVSRAATNEKIFSGDYALCQKISGHITACYMQSSFHESIFSLFMIYNNLGPPD